jgi:chromate transporter
VAGLAGAAVSIAAMCGPTCLIAFAVARTWDRFKDARWRMAVQAGLVPVSLGLISASAFVLARASDHNAYAALITGATAATAFFTRLNPLWVFTVAGALGFARLVSAATSRRRLPTGSAGTRAASAQWQVCALRGESSITRPSGNST